VQSFLNTSKISGSQVSRKQLTQ